MQGHGGHFDRATLDAADAGRFVTNALRWAAGEDTQAGPRIGVVSDAGQGELRGWLTAAQRFEMGPSKHLDPSPYFVRTLVRQPSSSDVALETPTRAGGAVHTFNIADLRAGTQASPFQSFPLPCFHMGRAIIPALDLMVGVASQLDKAVTLWRDILGRAHRPDAGFQVAFTQHPRLPSVHRCPSTSATAWNTDRPRQPEQCVRFFACHGWEISGFHQQ